jgi:hypothetical protein
MRIQTWRLLLTGGAIAILAVAGIGLVAGATAPKAPTANVVAVESTHAPDASGKPDRPEGDARLGKHRERFGAAKLLRIGRHLVHAEITVVGRDDELIDLQLDHGTVQAAGGGSLTIAEQGGKTETVSTDAATIVYVGRKDGSLADLSVGAEVFVQSRLDGGSPLAKHILVVPAGV